VDDALDAWDMAVVLDPELSDGVFQAYGWLIRRGDLDLARKYLDRERHPIRRSFYEGLLDYQVGNRSAARQTWLPLLDMDVTLEDPGLAAWVEAALRLGEPARVDERLTDRSSGNQGLPASVVALHGMAKLMMGEVEEATSRFEGVTARMRRAWPSRDRMPADRWKLLCTLVPDAERRALVKDFFVTNESED
jgi:hypothetical protein